MSIRNKRLNGNPTQGNDDTGFIKIAKLNGIPVAHDTDGVIEERIVDGPNRDKIIDSFKYAHDGRDTRIPVSFVISLDGDSKMRTDGFRVLSIEHEDGSGHSFNLTGDGYASTIADGRLLFYCKWKAYYNASTRKGSIMIHFQK